MRLGPVGRAGGSRLRLPLYLGLLLLYWCLLFFVLIPADSGKGSPEEAFELIEGQRAYAALIREGRPTLAVTIRGLNMAGAPYSRENAAEGQLLRSGNVRMFYDFDGAFLRLEILSAPEAGD